MVKISFWRLTLSLRVSHICRMTIRAQGFQIPMHSFGFGTDNGLSEITRKRQYFMDALPVLLGLDPSIFALPRGLPHTPIRMIFQLPIFKHSRFKTLPAFTKRFRVSISMAKSSMCRPCQWWSSDDYESSNPYLESVTWKSYSHYCTSTNKHDHRWLKGESIEIFVLTDAQFLRKGQRCQKMNYWFLEERIIPVVIVNPLIARWMCNIQK